VSVKLIVPYIGELLDLDARLVCLAQFPGIPCETFALADEAEHVEFLKKTVPDQCSCFVVNPAGNEKWVGLDGISANLAANLLARLPHLLVHGLRVEAFDTAMVAVLSRVRLSAELAPGSSQIFFLVHRNDDAPVRRLGLRRHDKAFARRRLSEVRDHYLCKNQRLLAIVNSLQRRFLKSNPQGLAQIAQVVTSSPPSSEISSNSLDHASWRRHCHHQENLFQEVAESGT